MSTLIESGKFWSLKNAYCFMLFQTLSAYQTNSVGKMNSSMLNCKSKRIEECMAILTRQLLQLQVYMQIYQQSSQFQSNHCNMMSSISVFQGNKRKKGSNEYHTRSTQKGKRIAKVKICTEKAMNPPATLTKSANLLYSKTASASSSAYG